MRAKIKMYETKEVTNYMIFLISSLHIFYFLNYLEYYCLIQIIYIINKIILTRKMVQILKLFPIVFFLPRKDTRIRTNGSHWEKIRPGKKKTLLRKVPTPNCRL